jgi:L-fuculose-phosphate aldolase
VQKTDLGLKKELVEVSKHLYNKGLIGGLEGNLSIYQNDVIYITPSGFSKGFLNEDMIIVTNINGELLEKNEYKPSSEIKLHLLSYQARDDIKSVIHTHSPYSTAFALSGHEISSDGSAELIALFGKIPLAKYGTIGSDEIFTGVKEYIYDYDVVLLQNHGIMAVAESIQTAFFKIETVENIAKSFIIAETLGGVKPLNKNQIAELKKIYDNRKRLYRA